QRGTPAQALEIYYLCLALGFRGAYGVTGDVDGLSGLVESARQQVARMLPVPSKIGPHALPTDRVTEVKLSHLLVYALVAGCTLLVLGVLFGLSYSLDRNLSEAMKLMPGPAAGR